jgi:hypothetical protein
LAPGAVVILTAVPAMSATVGTRGSSRLFSGSNYNLAAGTSFAPLRADVLGAGRSIVETTTVTASFLATIDVFYSGLLSLSFAFAFAFAMGEEAALYDWINAGGTMIYQGENAAWGPTTNTFLSTAGLTQSSNVSGRAALFATSASPLLANGVAGSSMPFSAAGGIVGAEVTLATGDAGKTVAFWETYGDGSIIGVMDVDASRDAVPRQFILNAIDYSVADVPLPAAAPLLAALGGLGVMARRRRRS